jgi:hypothetical protein
MVQARERSSHVRQMLAGFIQTWVGVEDGPVALIQSGEYLSK